MAEPMTTIAIVATILFCAHGELVNHKCPDGSDEQKQVIKLLVHDGDINDIVEIETNGKRVYTLRSDGTVIKSAGFNDDQAAKNFWLALAREAPKTWMEKLGK